MNIFIVGSGGREDTLANLLHQDPRVDEIRCAPGNAGMAQVGECLPINVDNLQGLVTAARDYKADLTIVGPEVPLCAGIVDLFQKHGLAIYGPTQAAARLEGSKWYAKQLLRAAGVPTGAGSAFRDVDNFMKVVSTTKPPYVVKADGLAGGKGVRISRTPEAAFLDFVELQEEFGASAQTILLEEHLKGTECSFIVIADGLEFVTLVTAKDAKRARTGDRGPNTGGMGCYAPNPALLPELQAWVEGKIVRPLLLAMARQGIYVQGTVYIGLMLTLQGPKVLEINMRFGDPETQVQLPLLDTPLLDLLLWCLSHELKGKTLAWKDQKAVGVVLASGGYPKKYQTGYPISGLEAAAATGALTYHSGTAVKEDGELVTNGGRVLTTVGLGDSYSQARAIAYQAARLINYASKYLRTDIAAGVE